eukprot:CAMPEP_0181223460 /NCGR_PEP_ID=MMETSP1096-20121128/30552_1 /TAXON_ID=156174 ORGANISM="Chrysochromulina ericina, Strain CCMP281" /NCGR_SAMPLE_ID=MMETSP1096 /ASSEMBLY_ACC=CAM_ASM_000453 /LENGTH=55 /DNA_ID=CAMNT_0023316371 /DNA_START=875 /DNA_END=1042 /DNA_ORIENTATION=+
MLHHHRDASKQNRMYGAHSPPSATRAKAIFCISDLGVDVDTSSWLWQRRREIGGE